RVAFRTPASAQARQPFDDSGSPASGGASLFHARPAVVPRPAQGGGTGLSSRHRTPTQQRRTRLSARSTRPRPATHRRTAGTPPSPRLPGAANLDSPWATPMNPMPHLDPMLKQLPRSGSVDSPEARNRHAIESKLAYIDFLALLRQGEVARRDHRQFAQRLRKA